MKKEYSEDSIRSISWKEAIRLRPELHFSDCFESNSLDNLPLEVACHAIDEALDGNCTTIRIELFDDYFSLEYDAGMLGAEDIMTKIFTCRNMKKHLTVGEKYCKLGIATVNAGMEYCQLTTVSNKEKVNLEFNFAEAMKHEVIPDAKEAEFTKIVMKPSTEIFKELTLSYKGVKQKVEALNQEFPNTEILIIKGNS